MHAQKYLGHVDVPLDTKARQNAEKLGQAPLEGLRLLDTVDRRSCLSTKHPLLLLDFAGALRRSELVGLDVADVVEGTDGLTVRLRRSKTDQEGAGRTVGIPFGSNPVTCPVRAWRAWLEVSGITEGPAFPVPWTAMATSAQHDSAARRWRWY
jgi:hypothetical protein